MRMRVCNNNKGLVMYAVNNDTITILLHFFKLCQYKRAVTKHLPCKRMAIISEPHPVQNMVRGVEYLDTTHLELRQEFKISDAPLKKKQLQCQIV
jgi:hypothetical protein